MDLTKKVLPNTVMVGGKAYSIYTDFRVWMKFENDVCAGAQGVDGTKIFKNEIPPRISMKEMFVFSRPETLLPRNIGGHSDRIILDYEIDADYIYAAFMAQYGIDLIEVEELHWHKFLALLKGINSDQKLAQIMSYRCYEKNANNKDQYAELEYAWRIEKMSEEEIEELEEFNNMFQ